jgi:transcriptional antiterminator RfaH
MKRWYAINTRPHQEARAVTHLARQGFQAWLPRLRRDRRHARRFETVLAPLFPGYLFIELDPERQPWRAINGTFGVRQIVLGAGGGPAALASEFVGALLARCDQEGVVRDDSAPLAPGDPVKIISGPFVGCIGELLKLEAHDRVTVLLRMLARTARIALARAAVAEAA